MDNKQIEEMAEEIQRYVLKRDSAIVLNFTIGGQHKRGIAEHLIKKGYRKERVGHWFIREYEFFTCSECGHDYWNSCDCTKEAKERLAEGDTPNFCPNCGSKMKGEDNG